MAAQNPEKLAVALSDRSATMTYGEFEATSNRFANALKNGGAQTGDVLAILMENRIEFLALAWGALRVGLRVTAIATHLSATEIDYILTDSQALFMVTSPRFFDTLERLHLPQTVFALDDTGGQFIALDFLLPTLPATPPPYQTEGVEMLYSSGTTGSPKGILKPPPIGPFGQVSAIYQNISQLYQIDRNTRFLSPAPLYHAAPWVYSFRTLRAGGTVVIMPKFTPEDALAAIENYCITHSQWVPTHFVRMLNLPAEIRTGYDLSSQRCVLHSAAPCPKTVKNAMIDWWGPIIREYYAGSEGNGHVSITAAEWQTRPESVGRAKAGIVHICDENGNELPTGSEGTIYFEGGPTFEYLNDPVKTKACYNSQGWSTLGDIGMLDADGYLYLKDRKTDLIISGGVNIYPREVENAMLLHPKVTDVAVFGIPDTDLGARVVATIQPCESAFYSEALAREILDFCRHHLSPVKCPKEIMFKPDLPRTESGKLNKLVLRATFIAQMNRPA
ncbi:Long-chain-fatty-acid-CoA ligase [Sulfitobacter geojensis]|nr:AMP-binding protein [Sulfitobacter geojensis]KHA54060.1 Long-chain-fatty-acid-CoA ligase [Sulfitobacter geojensis]